MGKPWFGAKTYGIGVSPKSPAGWLAILVYAAGMAAAAALGRQFNAASWVIGLVMLGLTIGLLALVAVKSDHRPWRWRWGGR